MINEHFFSLAGIQAAITEGLISDGEHNERYYQ